MERPSHDWFDPFDPDPGDTALDWLHNGAVVREQTAPEVYLLYGSARFHIPSPDELFALGLTWAQVVIVPDGATSGLSRVPDRGTLVRERSRPEIWLSVGDRLWHVPNPDTMRLLGLDWAAVHIVPDGSLAGLPLHLPVAAFSTPASAVFPPTAPGHWPRTDVPGFSLPNGARVVELRGWLRAVDEGPNGADPDWHLQLEPDPAWLDRLGVNWSTFYKVGDILAMGIDPLTGNDDQRVRVATPTIHLEVNGWDPATHPGVAPPSDWTVGKDQGGQLDGVIWPYLPTTSGGAPTDPPLVVGQYVRVVGSVVHDIPHSHGQGGAWSEFWHTHFGIGGGSNAYNTAAQDWSGQLPEEAQDNLARWSEIHPPDLIVAGTGDGSPEPARTENVYGVVLVARSATLSPSPAEGGLTIRLVPPAPRPPHTRAAIREFVGPETRYGSIVEGNPTHSGAAITLDHDGATIHVKVHGDPFAGSSGRFKAVYRLGWVPDLSALAMHVTQSPGTIPAGVPAQVTFTAVDADTGAPVAGSVRWKGSVLGATNTPLTALFQWDVKRVWEPGEPSGPPSGRKGHWEEESVEPVVTVVAPGYASVSVSVALQ